MTTKLRVASAVSFCAAGILLSPIAKADGPLQGEPMTVRPTVRPTVNKLSLHDAIEKALSVSPEMAGLRAQVQSAEAKAAQTLAPTEPTLGLTLQDMNTPYHGLGDQASRVFTVTQPFNFPGKAFINHAASSAQTDGLRAQYEAMRLSISGQVKAAYYQVAIARENLQLNDQQRGFLARILNIAKRRYEAGAITQVDLLNSEVALHSNENDTLDLESASHTAISQLNVLMGDSPTANIEVEELKLKSRPPLDYPSLEAKMVSGRNELKVADAQLRAASRMKRLALMALLPDFQLTAGTTFYDISGASPLSGALQENGNHTYFAGLQMTVPIWFWFDQRQSIAAASSDRTAAEANLHSVLNQSKLALDSAIDSLKANEGKIRNFEDHILPAIDQSLNLAIINYGVGKIDFQTLSDTATLRRTTRQAYQQSVFTYLTTYSNLGQLIGEDL